MYCFFETRCILGHYFPKISYVADAAHFMFGSFGINADFRLYSSADCLCAVAQAESLKSSVTAASTELLKKDEQIKHLKRLAKSVDE